MILTDAAPVQVDVSLRASVVVEGGGLDAQVLVTALRDITWTACEVALVTKATFLSRGGSAHTTQSTGPMRRTEVRAGQQLPGPGPVAAGEHVVLPVSVTVPADGPGSAVCPLVQVMWFVVIRLQVSGYAAKEVSIPFTVLSRAAARAAVAERVPITVDHGRAVLGVEELSSRHLSPGRDVRGVLVVDPWRPLSARGARVTLALRQEVHAAEWSAAAPMSAQDQDRDLDTVVACVTLPGPFELDPAEPLRLPFTLIVPPELPGPSLHTQDFTLSWVLRAVLDRPRRPDPYVEIELHGSTAPD